MNILKTARYAALVGIVALAAGCNNGNSSPTVAPGFQQLDRLARPAVNEVLATFARHDVNNRDTPADDANQLKTDINTFMTTVAGRSQAISNVAQAVLVPDVMIADLSQTGGAAYLGVETGGATSATKSKFGGRALTDDIVDISLGVIFGNTVPALGLAPDDNAEQDGRADSAYPSGKRPVLTTDNVGPGGKRFTATFPYLGAPR